MKKTDRFFMVVPTWLKEEIKQKADEKGITMSEYIKDALKDKVARDKERSPVKNNQQQ